VIGHSLTFVVLLTTKECARCHQAEAKRQPETSMAHALELPDACSILKSRPVLTLTGGRYTYRIEHGVYSVSDGHNTVTAPIRWAVGLGSAGQTYLYEKDGELYQSRVSYYRAIDALDFTLGALNAKPANLSEAAGQLMDRQEKAKCFGCHATGAIPGVQCERCHGSIEDHLAKLTPMKSLRKLTTEEMSNFCGQCHRTWDEIASSGIRGVIDVRFQPYRLTNSKCYDPDDARISCVACHDPHQEVERRDRSYDSKCQACHAGGKASAKACKVAGANCVGCHMPKVEIPGSHNKFTDHEIRIVRANAPYPD